MAARASLIAAVRLAAPVLAALVIALMPTPTGLATHAWYFFAIFAGVVLGLVLEPLPNGAVGVVGVTAVACLAPWALFSPSELAAPGFDAAARAIEWALSGFQSPTVWLVFAAFMFGRGYEKTGLGKRLALLLVERMGGRTLHLGYAVALFDALLAPFTPSNTARSAGTVYPVVRHLPALYESHPNDPSARRIGGYLMWTAFATGCITSSLFLTALSPNLLAVEFLRRTAGIEVGWAAWFAAAAPFGIPMLLALPWLVYVVYPPEIRQSPAIAQWAAHERAATGPLSRDELVMAGLAALALALWIGAPRTLNATTVALLVIAVMLMRRILSWNDVVGHGQAWDALVRLATLVTLADGLRRTGVIDWIAAAVAVHVVGLDPRVAAVSLVVVYYLSHYMFATTTAHVVAVFPVMIVIGKGVPGLPIEGFAVLLALTHGIMGVMSPYATGPSPVYHGSGYITNRAYWGLGAIFGAMFLAALLLLSGPVLLRSR